jgi:glutamate synthase (NADPH/NADH) small chain
VTQIEIMDRPPNTRPADQPWPTMARLFKTTSAHEEGGERWFSSETLAFVGADELEAITVRDRHSGETHEVATSMVLIAAGFTGPEADGLGVDANVLNERNTLAVDDSWRLPVTGTPVFACGDAVRGQSLIVWAIAEGRSAAAAVDSVLRGATSLPAPVTPAMVSW